MYLHRQLQDSFTPQRSSQHTLLTSLVLLLILLIETTDATCYHRDGSPVTDTAYQPCWAVVSADSMCCGLQPNDNRTMLALDQCLSDGLCFNPAVSALWRESCTDPTWRSPACLGSICVDVNNGGQVTKDAQLTQCPIDGTFCCGFMSVSTCCASPTRFELPPTLGNADNMNASITALPPSLSSHTSSTSSHAPSSTSSSNITGASTSLSASSDASASYSSTDSTRLTASIAITLSILLVVVSALGLAIYLGHRRAAAKCAKQTKGEEMGAREASAEIERRRANLRGEDITDEEVSTRRGCEHGVVYEMQGDGVGEMPVPTLARRDRLNQDEKEDDASEQDLQ